MTPQPSYRNLRAAWIMARAFTPHLVLAPLTLPWSLLSVIPGSLRRGLYLDTSRTGMVMLYRSNPILDVLVQMPVMVGLFAIYFAGVPALLGLFVPAELVVLAFCVVTMLFMIGLLFLLSRGGGSLFP